MRRCSYGSKRRWCSRSSIADAWSASAGKPTIPRCCGWYDGWPRKAPGRSRASANRRDGFCKHPRSVCHRACLNTHVTPGVTRGRCFFRLPTKGRSRKHHPGSGAGMTKGHEGARMLGPPRGRHRWRLPTAYRTRCSLLIQRKPFSGVRAPSCPRQRTRQSTDYRVRCSLLIQRESLSSVRRPSLRRHRRHVPASYRARCSLRIQRTVPLEERMTTLSVVMRPPGRRFTPSSSEPEVTPVAAKMQSPLARSSSL